MPNSDPWGLPGNSFMTICVFYVNPQIPNIEYFEAYEVYKSQDVSFFVSSNFPSNAVRIMSGELFLIRVMTIFVFYVNPQTPNIEYFEAYEVYKSREVSHLPKPMILIILRAFWLYQTLGDILTSLVSNAPVGKRSEA